MAANQIYTSDVAFSDTVKAIQTRKGSRKSYAKMEDKGSWTGVIDESLKLFIESQRSAYLGSASADGQPYIQHRGGPPGFLRVLDEHTIGFADYQGNKQFISQGNFEDNAKAFLFLMDYSAPQRLKLWGEARVVENDDELVSRLMPDGYDAKPEQAILFTVSLWNANCNQHIPRRFEAEDVARALEIRDKRIAELEATIASLSPANAIPNGDES